MRLSDSLAIRKVFKKQPVFYLGMKLFINSNGLSYNRYLFTFRRNFATAVKRNTIKRACREILRHFNKQLKQGQDLVFLFIDSGINVSDLSNPIRVLLEKAELFV